MQITKWFKVGKVLILSSRGKLHNITCFSRIQGIGRVRRMYAQLDPMKQIVNELKKDRDSSMKKITGIEKDISGLIQSLRYETDHS